MADLNMRCSRGMWKTLELWLRIVVECRTSTRPSRSLKNCSAERCINCGGATQEVSAATVFATGLETLLVIFWQKKKSLFNLHILRTFLELNLKMMK